MALKSANMALSFLVELCAIAALSYWGFNSGTGTFGTILLGVGAPALAIVIWGLVCGPSCCGYIACCAAHRYRMGGLCAGRDRARGGRSGDISVGTRGGYGGQRGAGASVEPTRQTGLNDFTRTAKDPTHQTGPGPSLWLEYWLSPEACGGAGICRRGSREWRLRGLTTNRVGSAAAPVAGSREGRPMYRLCWCS